MPTLNMYVPITKVDEVQRLVYGTLASETVDKTGEVFDYESSKPLIKEWSGEIEKATEGKSVGNLRFMHTKEVVGKFVQMECDDEKKSVEVCAKVSDDKRWQQVVDGEVTGFSVGGSYERRWTDKDGLKRYTAKPSEGSLVDNPANPDAHFTMVKTDGSTELRKFHAPAPEKPALDPTRGIDDGVIQGFKTDDGEFFMTKAEARKHRDELAKAAEAAPSPLDAALAGLAEAVTKAEAAQPKPVEPVEKREFSDKQREDAADKGEALPDGSFPIKNKDDLGNAVKAYGRAKNKKAAKAHIIKRAKDLGADGELPDSWKDTDAGKAARADELRKDLSTVARLAVLIQELEWVQESTEWETEREGDESKVPEELKKSITDLCACLRAMVEEETNEMLDEDEMFEFGEMLEMSARAPLHKVLSENGSKLLTKAGARHGKADAMHLDAAHDHIKKAMGEHGEDCDKLMPGAEKSHADNKDAHIVHAHNMVKSAGAGCPGGMSKCAGYGAKKVAAVKEDEGMSKADHLHAAHDHLAKMGIGACSAEKLAKAGARHSATDMHALTQAHDSLKEAGADCPGGESKCMKDMQGEDGSEPAGEHEPSKPGPSKEPKTTKDSAVSAGDLQKMLDDERAKHSELEKTMVAAITALTEKVQKIADQPMPRPGEFQVGETRFKVIEKSGATGAVEHNDEEMADALAKMNPDARMALLIKVARAGGQSIVR
jgi:hypothetical protein